MTDNDGAPEAPAEELAPMTLDEATAAVAEAPQEVVERPEAAPDEPEDGPEPTTGPRVRMKVSKAGAGLIFKGELIGGVEQTFAEGDEFEALEHVAAIHEARGLAERA